MDLLKELFEKLIMYSDSAFYGFGIAMSVAGITIILIYRTYLAKSVALFLEAKGLENAKAWKIVAFIFGLVGVALCLIINIKVGSKITDEKIKKLLKKYIINALVFGILVVPIQQVEMTYIDIQNLYYSKHEIEYYHTAFYDEGEDSFVCYDKMGNAYTISDDYNKIALYDKDGHKFVEDENDNYICYETSTKVAYDDAYIDTDGNFVKRQNLSDYMYYDEEYMDTYRLFCYDKNKTVYYPIQYCSWDKDGNLILNEELQKFDFDSFKNK